MWAAALFPRVTIICVERFLLRDAPLTAHSEFSPLTLAYGRSCLIETIACKTTHIKRLLDLNRNTTDATPRSSRKHTLEKTVQNGLIGGRIVSSACSFSSPKP